MIHHRATEITAEKQLGPTRNLCGYHESRAADPSALVAARAKRQLCGTPCQLSDTPCPLQYGPARRYGMTRVARDDHRTPNLWPRTTKPETKGTRSSTELARSSTERATGVSRLNLPAPALPAMRPCHPQGRQRYAGDHRLARHRHRKACAAIFFRRGAAPAVG